MENYEEKYKTALANAEFYHKETTNTEVKNWLEYAFPELRESKDDRIKRCIQVALTDVDEKRYNDYGTTLKDCLAWLEKQGENPIEQDTEIYDLWVYIREWNDKFGRLPKDEDELAACIDYVMKRQKPTWSEEDEEALNNIITAFKRIGENCEHYFSPDTAKVFEKTLESIKDKIQPKQEWSSDDLLNCNQIIDILQEYNRTELIDWLESIEPNHWKPSKEQMQALNWIAYNYALMDKGTEEKLQSLYNDLKNL